MLHSIDANYPINYPVDSREMGLKPRSLLRYSIPISGSKNPHESPTACCGDFLLASKQATAIVRIFIKPYIRNVYIIRAYFYYLWF